ncbi:hypothetical protein LOTGIDRAFT_213858 [Lottia gigantea]|uniref:Protein arginine N-methyltransferase n=1 Tax=Lottia gigantea TaxID=225164 RepID=V4AM60_LOTGI|nr:hypothetical protein LOTGIDRAFT_213858 [Lottia gigantea]ESO98227.1 hypothetical protein LOTGIDRAFT_213858 [Lottia gigantea]
MSTFTSRLCPITGKMQWILQDEEYDYHQEIARSAYADMLHDTERNKKYYTGVKKAIEMIHARGEKAKVLDIGTGTGLLSMMAAASGADQITACEAFEPMAKCAEEIIKKNNYADQIKLIPKRSTEMKSGPGNDMEDRANILVTEVLDTELIGEGAIGTYNHAHKHLLEKKCLVIPRAANMYVQLVSSDFIKKWNVLQPIKTSESRAISPPLACCKCSGAASLHDIQLDQLDSTLFTPISQPVQVFRFDFASKEGIPEDDNSTVIIKSLNKGSVDAVLMWWDIEVDPQGEVILSCAPRWAHPDGDRLQVIIGISIIKFLAGWRDHWMQAIYYPTVPITVDVNQSVKILSSHDEYSLWFEVVDSHDTTPAELERPICECGIHTSISRTRIGQINDTRRNDVFISVLKQNLTTNSICLCISDGSLLPLMAAQLGAKKVFVIESNPMCERVLKSYINYNRLNDKITVFTKPLEDITAEDLFKYKINVVIGEPFFMSSNLPWENMYFWYAVSELRQFMVPDVAILPYQMTIKAVGMQFKDLWKIRAPVGNCEGFDLDIFDNIIQKSSEKSDINVERQPLWEYPGLPLTDPVSIAQLDWSKSVFDTKPVSSTTKLPFNVSGELNGIALWVEYQFSDNNVISNGPLLPVVSETNVRWDYYSQQAVHLYKQPISIQPDQHVDINFHFNPKTGELDFKFPATVS